MTALDSADGRLATEVAGRSSRPGSPRPSRRWGALAVVAIVAASVRAGLDPGGLVNPGGWTQVERFFGAMFRPRADAEFLRLAATEAAVTLGFALLGTALALLIGAIGAVVISERWWASPAGLLGRARLPWVAGRSLFAVPRAIHEVVFGLLLVNVLGLNPLVAILAIGIPYGAVTAKVFSELIDETAAEANRALRAGGASRLSALLYGTLPAAADDLVSYGFYRFECALRSAAVLGIVGAGGLGFQLALSFISLRYEEMWTFLWALILLSGAADLLSSAVRRRSRRDTGSGHDRLLLGGVGAFTLTLPVAYVLLDVELSSLFDARARRLGGELVADSWPPQIGTGGLTDLLFDSVDTAALAVLSIAGAVALAFVPSFAAARTTRRPEGSAVRLLTGVWRSAVRLVLLIARSIPPPVGAFIAVFVFFPGLWPGAVALAVYNGGVLGRLQAEVVENLDPRPADVLRAGGAGRWASMAYATVPAVVPRFTALGLYRWEVAVRETVVVGVVGAAGLGRRLDQQTASFDYDGITATLLALVLVTVGVDLLSATVRRSLRASA